MEATALDRWLRQTSERMRLGNAVFLDWDPRQTRPYELLDGGIAVIPISGALSKADRWWSMGATARQYGFRGWFPELCEAESGLEYGCCYLADLRRQFGQEGWPVVVRAYNGGPGGRHEESNPYPGEVLEKLGGRWPDVPA